MIRSGGSSRSRAQSRTVLNRRLADLPTVFVRRVSVELHEDEVSPATVAATAGRQDVPGDDASDSVAVKENDGSFGSAQVTDAQRVAFWEWIVPARLLMPARVRAAVVLTIAAVVPCLLAVSFAVYRRMTAPVLPSTAPVLPSTVSLQYIHMHPTASSRDTSYYVLQSRDGAYVMSVSPPTVTRWATADVDPLAPDVTPVTMFQCQNDMESRFYANNAFFGSTGPGYATRDLILTVCYVGEDGDALPSRNFSMPMNTTIPTNDTWWVVGVYDAGSQALVSDPVTVFVAGLYNMYQFRVSLVDSNASLVDTFPWLNSLEPIIFNQDVSASSDTVSVVYRAGQFYFIETFPFVPNTGRAIADTDKIYRGFVFENVLDAVLLQSKVLQTALVLTPAGLYMLDFGEEATARNFSQNYTYTSYQDNSTATLVPGPSGISSNSSKFDAPYFVQPTIDGESLVLTYFGYDVVGTYGLYISQVKATQPSSVVRTWFFANQSSWPFGQDAFVAGPLPKVPNALCLYGNLNRSADAMIVLD